MAAPSDSESDPMRSITPSSELEEYKRVFTTFSFISPSPPAYLFPKFPEENDHWGLWCLGCPRRFLSRDWPFVWETTWTISTRSSSALFQLLKQPGGCLDFLVLLSSPQWKLNSVGYLQNLTLSSHNHTSFQPLCRTITLDLTNDHFRYFLDWYRVSIFCSKKIKTPLLWIFS